MNIRHAEEKDIDAIMTIYDTARSFMRAHGNMNQWINGFPQRALIADDVHKKINYVVTDDDGVIHGVFAFILGRDPTYTIIEDGAWLNDEPYGTIHRIASDGKLKGIATYVFDYAKSLVRNVRIDTHRDNYVMQNALAKNGFVRCGIIHIEDGSERIAFQFVA